MTSTSPRLRSLMSTALSALLALGFALPAAGEPAVASAAVAPAGVTTVALRGVAFTDSSVGYAVGAAGTILKTTNGGSTWTTSRSGGGYDLRGVGAYGNSVVAVDYLGAAVRSIDAGGAWEVPWPEIGDPFYDTSLHGVDLASSTMVFAVGGAYDCPPISLRSQDRGYSWPLAGIFTAGEYEPPNELPPYPKLGLGEFYDVDFVSTSKGWAVGHDRYKEKADDPSTLHNDGVIWSYDTARGAIPWAKQAKYAGSGPLYGVSFGSSTWGIAVGSGGKAYWTGDGGTTWTAAAVTGTTANLRAVAAGTYPTAWAVGDGGVILKTADGGANWTVLASPTGANLYGIAFRSGTSAVAVGSGGTILRTIDGTAWGEVGVPPSAGNLTSTTHPVSTTWYPSRTATFSWVPNGGATAFSYAFDQSPTTNPDATPEPAGTTKTYTSVADGTWYFHIKATDGSIWGDTAHRQIRVDGTIPTLGDDAEAAYVGSASIGLTAADTGGSGVKEIRYALDGGAEEVVPGSTATAATSVLGPHQLRARSYDNAGNASAETVIDFEVLGVPSVTSASSTTHGDPARWYAARTVTFGWSGSPAVTGYSYAFDQSPTTDPDTAVEPAGTTKTYTSVGDGIRYFHVKATNGLTWSAPSHVQVRVDGTIPTLSHDAEASYAGEAVIHLSAADAGGSGVKEIVYTLDSGSPVTVSGSSATFSTAQVGSHTLTARSYDNAGNASDAAVMEFEVTEPTTPMAVSVASPTHPLDGEWSTDPTGVTFTWVGTGGATGYSYRLGDAASDLPDETQDTSDSWVTFATVADGDYYFSVKATDGSTWGPLSIQQVLRIDATVPTLSHDGQAMYTTSASIHLTATDACSGVDRIEYTLDSGAPVTVEGGSATVSTSVLGDHTLTARSYDAAGNPSTQRVVEFTVVAPPTGMTYVPIEGPDRFSTAIEVSQKAFPSGAGTVILATGYNWPDALGGAALAKAYDAPILLVKPNELPSAVSTEISRLNATKVIILGSEAAVSKAVEDKLESRLGAGDQVSRLGGANRYDTARKVAAAVKTKMGAAFEGWAFVATGGNFPDALAGSPISAAKGWPIYLVGDTLTSADTNAMKSAGVTNVVILGGTPVVSSKVESGLKSAFGSSKVLRKYGSDRYATARVVAGYGVSKGLHWDGLALATGQNFPDALAGGVLQGKDGSVMLLTPGTKLDDGVASLLRAQKPAIHEVRYLGSTSAIGTSVRNAVKAILK